MKPLAEDLQAITSTAGHERRINDRLDTASSVRLRRFEPQQWRAGVCTDIGNGGIGLDTFEVLKVGEVIEIEMLDADGAITVRARVVYRQRQHYGLSFLDDPTPPPPPHK